jgi:hypothetical protein
MAVPQGLPTAIGRHTSRAGACFGIPLYMLLVGPVVS